MNVLHRCWNQTQRINHAHIHTHTRVDALKNYINGNVLHAMSFSVVTCASTGAGAAVIIQDLFVIWNLSFMCLCVITLSSHHGPRASASYQSNNNKKCTHFKYVCNHHFFLFVCFSLLSGWFVISSGAFICMTLDSRFRYHLKWFLALFLWLLFICMGYIVFVNVENVGVAVVVVADIILCALCTLHCICINI